MLKVLLSASFLVMLGTVAQASPTASAKHAGTAASQKYWLSDGLNRLVFWRPPGASSQADTQTAH